MSIKPIIPMVITQFLAEKTEIKLGSLMLTRDFNFVRYTANGFYYIYRSEKTIEQEINIATQYESSIGDIAREMIRQINFEATIVCDEQRLRPKKSEVNRFLGCNTKNMALTDWRPQYAFKEGIAETIRFFRENLDKYKTDIYNLCGG